MNTVTEEYTCISEPITTPYEITYNATTAAYKTSARNITIGAITYTFPNEDVPAYRVTQDGDSINEGDSCYNVRVSGGVMTEIGKMTLPDGDYASWQCKVLPPDTSSPSSCSTDDQYYFYTCTLTRASGARGVAVASVLLLAFAAMIAVAASVVA